MEQTGTRAKKSVGVESPATTTITTTGIVPPKKKKPVVATKAKKDGEELDGEELDDDDDDDDDDETTTDDAGNRSGKNGASSLTQQWSRDEDALLMRLISQHGAKRWSYIATQMQGRRGKQCRDRYLNHLRPGIKTGLWTPEEEVVLIEGHKILGTKWAALAKLLEGRPENAIKNHWHATWRCKWTKIQGEGKLTPLQKYQLALRGETPEHLASQARASAKKRREEKKIAKIAKTETAAAPPKEEVEVPIPEVTEATEATEATEVTEVAPPPTATTVDTRDDEDAGGGAENVDESFAARSGMSRSAQNSRYSRAEREEIDVSLKKMRERMSKELETITSVDPGAAASTQLTDSNAATTTDVVKQTTMTAMETPTETETKTPKTKTKKTKKTAAGEPNPTQLARASVSSKSQDFIDVGEHPIGIAQCQAAVMSTGAAESTMLTSVAQRAGPVYLREYCELSPYCIRKGVEAITLVMRTKWPLSRIAVAIRTGSLQKGDLKLCIAVSGEKWDDVIAAAEFASSQIKTKFLFRELKLSLIASGQEEMV